MMDRLAGDAAVERYLERVRSGLKGMSASRIDDIVLELRGHIAERSEASGDPSAALDALGDPGDLARQYRTEAVTASAECSRSPLVILHSLMLLRRWSIAGWTVLALTAFGYAWALALGAAAIEKMLSPHDVGLWSGSAGGSWPRLMIDGPGPPGTRELLGWWIVPLGLAACGVLLYATRRFALWWIRRSRKREGSNGTIVQY